MKLLREDIEAYIEKIPKARERALKDRAIVNVLLERYPLIKKAWGMDIVDKETLIQFVQDHNSMDRAWRKVMEERPELRGTDYDDKVELAKEAQLELGYKV